LGNHPNLIRNSWGDCCGYYNIFIAEDSAADERAAVCSSANDVGNTEYMPNTPQAKFLMKILKITLVVVALIPVIVIYGFTHYKNQDISSIRNESWSHFPGATVTNSGIYFQPLHRIIVHQDGSVGQPNPPVNISGQHLLVKGDFKITAVASEINTSASLRLYAAPPIVYDQWRYETPSIDINIDAKNNVIVPRIFDGSSDTPMDIRTYKVFLPPKIIISLEHVKAEIHIIENDNMLGSMPDHGIFNSGAVWFGMDGIGSNGWTLSALDAQALGAGSVKSVSAPLLIASQNDPNSLRNLAAARHRKIKIGAAINISPLFTDEQYRNLALGQFSILTPENSMKPEFIHPEANVYDFSESDQLVDAALKNNIEMHGHTLVYGKSSPDWLTKSPVADRQHILVDHISTVVGRFKGKVAEWDVVNEPFSDKHALYGFGKSGLDPNIWFEAMGGKYIDIAFETAHKADPSAKLYLNDYGVEKDGQHWDALLSLVKRLKKRGVPINGVGFEAHVYTDGDYFDAKQLRQHMETLNKLGLLVRISEIDVTQDDAREQINQYVTALDVCLRASNCTSYSTWGVTDKYGSTTRSDRYPLVYGTSLLWDKDMKAKSAYSALQNRLKQAY